ncbi:MAG: hypothetical protein ACI97K_002505 [Glaciecola sp.]|jgi:hypothetical protein
MSHERYCLITQAVMVNRGLCLGLCLVLCHGKYRMNF